MLELTSAQASFGLLFSFVNTISLSSFKKSEIISASTPSIFDVASTKAPLYLAYNSEYCNLM
jgi:hypothetical protein